MATRLSINNQMVLVAGALDLGTSPSGELVKRSRSPGSGMGMRRFVFN